MDTSWSVKAKDDARFPAFSLVNKATGQALRHQRAEKDKCIRPVNNTHLNLDASAGDDKHHVALSGGTEIVLCKWNKKESQKWRINPILHLICMNLYLSFPRPDLVLGLSPHSDGGGITLLLQDEQTEGLHVRKDNQWISMKPIPYALVVNIGELVEVIRNVRYKSIEHRTVTSQERSRLFVVLLYSEGMYAKVAPSSKIVDED
jgi:hypothetical protein